MISFWHLSAVCCIPSSNPKARIREQEIFRQVADRKQPADEKNGHAKHTKGSPRRAFAA